MREDAALVAPEISFATADDAHARIVTEAALRVMRCVRVLQDGLAKLGQCLVELIVFIMRREQSASVAGHRLVH